LTSRICIAFPGTGHPSDPPDFSPGGFFFCFCSQVQRSGCQG
jgi:hypothetical protein